MTYKNDSIDWIGAKEVEMREYEEGLRLVKEISQSDEISYIMENLNSKPLNELRRCIGMKEVEPARVPNADWFRDKLGVGQGLADRFEGYCNPDEASKAIREYREKDGLSDDVPLCNEIRDVLESNGSIINEILDSLLRLYSSIYVTNTYDTEFVGYFKLDEAVDIIVDFFKTKKISRLLLEKEIAKVIHRAVIFKGIEMMEEEDKKLAAREAIIDMAKGLGKVVEENKNDDKRN